MTTVTVEFIECSPPPVGGYNLKWRVAGTSDPLNDAGNYFASPAVFVDSVNPDGTDHEGTLTADCGSGGMGEPMAWTTVIEESGCESLIQWENDGNGTLLIKKNGVTIIETIGYLNGGFPGGFSGGGHGDFTANTGDVIEITHTINSAGPEGEAHSTLSVSEQNPFNSLFTATGGEYPEVTFSFETICTKNYFISAGVTG